MEIEDYVNDNFMKNKREIFQGKIIFTAQCGQDNPIERYYNREGYRYKCPCGNIATIKTIFYSPTWEVDGPYFGARYHCENCAPDLDSIASNSDLFYGYIFGNIK